jgi:glutamate synthase domain-containing protein 3
MKIDAKGLRYVELNDRIREAIEKGEKAIVLDNVNGQRYIGGGLEKDDVTIVINGVPGNDLAAFMDGPSILVNSNAQDGVGDTMNSGKVVVNGAAGDIVGYSMRGGKIFIRDNVGYRVGIHMKSYERLHPVIIVGGCAGNFLGEYMAGGLIIILGLNRANNRQIVGNYVGTGMHGGTIYIMGNVEEYQLGAEVGKSEPSGGDMEQVRKNLEEFCEYFGFDLEKIMGEKFVKLVPSSRRPYERVYAY